MSNCGIYRCVKLWYFQRSTLLCNNPDLRSSRISCPAISSGNDALIRIHFQDYCQWNVWLLCYRRHNIGVPSNEMKPRYWIVLWKDYLITKQFIGVMTRLIFATLLALCIPYIVLEGEVRRVFVNAKFSLSHTLVTALTFSIWCYIWPLYDDYQAYNECVSSGGMWHRKSNLIFINIMTSNHAGIQWRLEIH